MTNEHLSALLSVAEAKTDGNGWSTASDERTITLYVAGGAGAPLTAPRIEAVRLEGELVYARSARGEVFVFALSDVFAGSVDGEKRAARAAGFAR